MIDEDSSFFVQLPARGFIHIGGAERYDFLQRLMTQDIRLLEKQAGIYACLLTPQGKFLHDFFLSEGPGCLVLECEGETRAQDLYTRLTLYKLRSDVTLAVERYAPVYMVFGAQPKPGFIDPRHAGLGWRAYVKPENIKEESLELWDRLRIRLGVPDGSRDAELEKSTLAELNIEDFHGVSFEKGCYIGQELTTRMKSRGLAKKRLYTVTGSALPRTGADIIVNGKIIGVMRGQSGDVGLALLKDEEKELLHGDQIRLLG